MNSFADNAISFFSGLVPPDNLPQGVEALFPYADPTVLEAIRIFFQRYFNDQQQRIVLVGINPGRFGAGITGINFTAPRQLSEDCGIRHSLGNTSELSAEFIYMVIRAFGGPLSFYRRFYLAAASPVGFIRNGKNLNYYDDPQLAKIIKPYIANCLQQQIELGCRRNIAICIGGDKNYAFIQSLNLEHRFFDEIIVLPHPRFILQYRRSLLETYLQQYIDALQYCLHK